MKSISPEQVVLEIDRMLAEPSGESSELRIPQAETMPSLVSPSFFRVRTS